MVSCLKASVNFIIAEEQLLVTIVHKQVYEFI